MTPWPIVAAPCVLMAVYRNRKMTKLYIVVQNPEFLLSFSCGFCLFDINLQHIVAGCYLGGLDKEYLFYLKACLNSSCLGMIDTL